MDELIKLVSQKTGLSEEMSKMAVETVVQYIKARLPEPLAKQVDSALAGDGAGDLLQGLGGLLGR